MNESRQTLKSYFQTGAKPTQTQFAALIDSLYHIAEDGGVPLVTALSGLAGTNKLQKNAVRGAEFALNLRGIGDIYASEFLPTMTNLLPGDFFIYYPDAPSPDQDNPAQEPENPTIVQGDWVVSMVTQAGPNYNYNFNNTAYWRIVHFGNTTITQTDLLHKRYVLDSGGDTATLGGIKANIISLTVNHFTYYGKMKDDEGMVNLDFNFEIVDNSTVVTINPAIYGAGFSFRTGDVVDILYKNI